jgi:hypothetical protein
VLRRRLVSLPLPEAAGWLAGRWLRFRHLVPGVAGGMGLSVAAGEVAGHVFGHGLTPWVALGAGSVLALALDRRL